MTCQGCSCSTPCGKGSSASLQPRRQLTSKGGGTETTPLWPTAPARQVETENRHPAAYGSVSGGGTYPDTGPREGPGVQSSAKRCEGNHAFRGGVCCRELKATDQRRLVDPDLVRDVIIGLSDGLTVPFALTAGLSGVGSTKLVVVAGLAELVSGAISMGVGGFLSAQAERQHYQWTKRQTQERVARSCSSAIADEINDVLGPYGIPADVAALVASKLQVVEEHRQQLDDLSLSLPLPAVQQSPVGALSGDTQTDMDEEGLTPFILRLGEGLEPISTSRAWQSAITIGVSYFLGGLLPLFPYIVLASIRSALLTSILVTGLVLLIFGVLKTKFTGGEEGFRGYSYGAVSTLAVGGLAAGASWLIVRTLEGRGEGGL